MFLQNIHLQYFANYFQSWRIRSANKSCSECWIFHFITKLISIIVSQFNNRTISVSSKLPLRAWYKQNEKAPSDPRTPDGLLDGLSDNALTLLHTFCQLLFDDQWLSSCPALSALLADSCTALISAFLFHFIVPDKFKKICVHSLIWHSFMTTYITYIKYVLLCECTPKWEKTLPDDSCQ